MIGGSSTAGEQETRLAPEDFESDSCFQVLDPSKDYIEQFKQRIDLESEYAQADVILFPDKHDVTDPSDVMRKQLDALKSAGFEVLLIELLPMGFEVQEESQEEIRELFVKTTDNRFGEMKGHAQLVYGAKQKGFRVFGFFPDRATKEEDYAELDASGFRRKHWNASDMLYTHNVMKIKEANFAEKIVIQVGLAHTNAYYENNDILDNSRMLGEFVHRGIPADKIQIYMTYTRSYPEVGNPFKWNVRDFYLPLPLGQRPGCSDIESYSHHWGIIFDS